MPRPTSKAVAVPPEASSPVLSKESLYKLSRIELQKTAKKYAIKANIKSEEIIQELLKLHRQKRPVDLTDDDGAPPSKRARHAKIPAKRVLPRRGSHAAKITKVENRDQDPGTSATHIAPPQLPPTIAQPDSPRTVIYDPNLFSESGTDRTDSPQPSFATPKSSRATTPLPSEIYHLERSVLIMREISKQDQEILAMTTQLRETAAKFRKQVQDTRDVIRAEKARRERMEAYFTYWSNIEGSWPPDWLYGPAMIPAKYLKPHGHDGFAGPPTLPLRGNAQKEQTLQTTHLQNEKST